MIIAKFNIDIIVHKSPKIVWKAYIDPQNMIQWTKYLEKVEVIKGEFGEVGAISHLHYLEKGRSYILEDKLLSYEEGKKILSKVSGNKMMIEVETILDSHQDGTKISMNWKGMNKSLLIKFILRLMQGKITKHGKSELITFKSLVETHGSKFPEKSSGNE